MDNINNNNVNHPSHYNQGKYEVIDVIKDALTKEELYGFCIANALKYILRAEHKHESPIEDLNKAVWYLNYIIDILKESK